MSKNERVFFSIDLKSFFAAAECIERGLNPFTTLLIVADPKRGNGAITLAVSPAMKQRGVKSRGRVFEIPRNLKYITAPPRMSLYLKKSDEVIEVFKKFFSEEDIAKYSIDEAFIEVTHYLKLYKKDPVELAEEVLETLEKDTGLTANCGIGSNIFLAKVAMDNEAKSFKNGIAVWNLANIEEKLWPLPLIKVWGIGPKMETRFNNLGIKTIKDLANFDKQKLQKKFGVIGAVLWDKVNGNDESTIKEYQERIKGKSISHSQVLFKDYFGENVRLIISEMVEVLTVRLRQEKKLTSRIHLGIRFSKDLHSGFHQGITIGAPTDDMKIITDVCISIFDQYYNNEPVRQVTVAYDNLSDKTSVQLDLFAEPETYVKEDNINEVIDEVRLKHGKNSVIKASSLLPHSTIKERNRKLRGHSAE